MGTQIWTNWSGSVSAAPQQVISPSREAELLDLVSQAGQAGQSIRIAGSGHSFVPLCASNDLILSLDNLQGVVSIDSEQGEATVWAGSKIYQLGEPLLAAGLGMENMGDIDRQSLAGAISTGTHGTGPALGSISTQVIGLRLVTARDGILELSAEDDTVPFDAVRVSLGALGIVSQIRLRLLPAYRLHERTWVESFETCFEKLDEQIAATRHFEFFWSPREDGCACKALQPTDQTALPESAGGVPAAGRLSRYISEERIDFSHRIFPSERNTLFNEMEFAVPAEQGPDCLKAIRDLMLTRHPDVLWPIEYRTLAADEIWLSPAYRRETVTISIHQAAELPHEAFFADAEAIFREFEGRPHWGKMHSFTPAELRDTYPKWGAFQDLRQRLDPDGRFMNRYLESLFLS